jgi:hypothetical protein
MPGSEVDMKPKVFLIAGTMALAISLGSLLQSEETRARSASGGQDQKSANVSAQDNLHAALGVSEEELYDALYDGQSLAEIAENNNKDVQDIIDLQTSQLAEQLVNRYINGLISKEQYEAHMAELKEIVEKSVYGHSGGSG